MPRVHALLSPTGTQSHEVALRALAARQEAVVSLRQLEEHGVSARAVRGRVAAGTLFRIHRGVYALLPTLSRRGQFFAAVLACGDGAALSHLSAAAEHKLRKHDYGPVHVTVPRSGARSRPGLVVHVSAWIPTETIGGLAVTTPERTLTDLADLLTPTQLQLAASTAERLGLFDRRQHTPAPGRRAITKHRHVFTRSANERTFVRLCRGLPPMTMNVPLGRWEADALFAEYGLVVEIDAWHTHGNPHAFETDRLKDAFFGDLGLQVRRITDRRLHEHGREVVAAVRRALASCTYVPGRDASAWTLAAVAFAP